MTGPSSDRATTCHCGQPAVRKHLPDQWEGRMDGYCDACASNRCDCYPDECPVKYPPTGPSSERTAHEAEGEVTCPHCGFVQYAATTHHGDGYFCQCCERPYAGRRVTSERTAGADVALVDALYALSTLLADQGLPGSPLTKQAADRLAALVAQHRDTQEALAKAADDFNLIRRTIHNSKSAPNVWESLSDFASWGEEAARAALASVRARTPARDGAAT